MVNPTPLAAYTNVAKYTNPSTIVRTVIEICLAVYDSGKVELSNPLETLLAKMYNTVDIAMPVKPPVTNVLTNPMLKSMAGVNRRLPFHNVVM